MCESTCNICLEKITEGFTLSCGHRYHNKCITEWLFTNQSCPTCRKQIIEIKEEKRLVESHNSVYINIKKQHNIPVCFLNYVKEHSINQIISFVEYDNKDNWENIEEYKVLDLCLTKKTNKKGKHKKMHCCECSILYNTTIKTHVFNICITNYKHLEINSYKKKIYFRKQKF